MLSFWNPFGGQKRLEAILDYKRLLWEKDGNWLWYLHSACVSCGYLEGFVKMAGGEKEAGKVRGSLSWGLMKSLTAACRCTHALCMSPHYIFIRYYFLALIIRLVAYSLFYILPLYFVCLVYWFSLFLFCYRLDPHPVKLSPPQVDTQLKRQRSHTIHLEVVCLIYFNYIHYFSLF